MELIKENKQKKRKTYRLDDRYRKVWSFIDIDWLENHVKLLNNFVPDYVINFNCNCEHMWIDYKIILGKPASGFIHSDEFIKKIYNFCLSNIRETYPYVHGDWVLSNIIIHEDNIKMCDWDNLNIYPREDIIIKLHKDLESSFGDKFNKFKNDSTSV